MCLHAFHFDHNRISKENDDPLAFNSKAPNIDLYAISRSQWYHQRYPRNFRPYGIEWFVWRVARFNSANSKAAKSSFFLLVII